VEGIEVAEKRSWRRLGSVGGGVKVSGGKKRSLDDAALGSGIVLENAYGEAVRFDNSGTPSSKSVLSFEGLRLALRARSSSLVGGVGMPVDLASFFESVTTTNRRSDRLINSGTSWMIGS